MNRSYENRIKRISHLEKCQGEIKKVVYSIIRKSGITVAEITLQYIKDHPEAELSVDLSHGKFIREFELVITEYKQKLKNKSW